MTERQYQSRLIKRLQALFPGAYIIKNDPRLRQGVPDILILFEDRWGMLEVKLTPDSAVQPNQDHYVRHFNKMSFASFINPDNEEEVISELQRSLRLGRASRIPQPQ